MSSCFTITPIAYQPDEAMTYQTLARFIDDQALGFYPRSLEELHPCIPAELLPPTAPGRSNHPGVYRPVDACTNRE